MTPRTSSRTLLRLPDRKPVPNRFSAASERPHLRFLAPKPTIPAPSRFSANQKLLPEIFLARKVRIRRPLSPEMFSGQKFRSRSNKSRKIFSVTRARPDPISKNRPEIFSAPNFRNLPKPKVRKGSRIFSAATTASKSPASRFRRATSSAGPRPHLRSSHRG